MVRVRLIEKIWYFKDVFKDCDCKFTQSISGTHIFITQSLFNQPFFSQLQVIVFKLCPLLFGEKICGSKFCQIIRRLLLFAYDETVTIPSRLIFTFAIFTLHICNMLLVQKEELFIKSPRLQISHAQNNKLKGRSFF